MDFLELALEMSGREVAARLHDFGDGLVRFRQQSTGVSDAQAVDILRNRAARVLLEEAAEAALAEAGEAGQLRDANGGGW